ncbi:hypothetical protein Tco_0642015 [Tanacetum coccineum]
MQDSNIHFRSTYSFFASEGNPHIETRIRDLSHVITTFLRNDNYIGFISFWLMIENYKLNDQEEVVVAQQEVVQDKEEVVVVQEVVVQEKVDLAQDEEELVEEEEE